MIKKGLEFFKDIRKDLMEFQEEEYRLGAVHYFKDPINPIGVRAGKVREIARRYFNSHIKGRKKEDVFNISLELLNKRTHEETMIAFEWISRLHREYSREDLKFFEDIISTYVNNWHFCDDFSCRVLAKYFGNISGEMSVVKKWVKDDNRWFRRAAYVSLVPLVRHRNRESFELGKDIFPEIFGEKEDIVHKGCGWLLKDSFRHFSEELFELVINNKHKMPRTVLRIAIEKMSKEQKREAMSK